MQDKRRAVNMLAAVICHDLPATFALWGLSLGGFSCYFCSLSLLGGTQNPAQQSVSWHEHYDTLVLLPYQTGILGFRLGWLCFLRPYVVLQRIGHRRAAGSPLGMLAPRPDDWMLMLSKHRALHACRFPSKELQVYVLYIHTHTRRVRSLRSHMF